MEENDNFINFFNKMKNNNNEINVNVKEEGEKKEKEKQEEREQENTNKQEQKEEEEEEVIMYYHHKRIFLNIIQFLRDFQKTTVESGYHKYFSLNHLIFILYITKTRDFETFCKRNNYNNFSLLEFLIYQGAGLDPIFLDMIIESKFGSIWIYKKENNVFEFEVPVSYLQYNSQLIMKLRYTNYMNSHFSQDLNDALYFSSN